MSTSQLSGLTTYPYDMTTSLEVYSTNYGASAKGGNCASYSVGDKLSADSPFIWWSEADAGASTIKRGTWASFWQTPVGIWPTLGAAATDTHVLSIALNPENFALFAVTPTRMWVTTNPSDVASLVKWFSVVK